MRRAAKARFTPGITLAIISSWCPKVMAAIGRLPETLEDRCIVVRMQRKLPHEPCERLREMGYQSRHSPGSQQGGGVAILVRDDHPIAERLNTGHIAAYP